MGAKHMSDPTRKTGAGVFLFGRGDRTRTCDILVPNQERYQLRYTSSFFLFRGAKVLKTCEKGERRGEKLLGFGIF